MASSNEDRFRAAIAGATRQLSTGAHNWERRKYEQARQIMQETAENGEDNMRVVAELKITETGLKRAAHGGDPGRINTGNMVDSLEHRVEETAGDRIDAVWGWRDPERYFLAQEHGTRTVEAMESIQTSMTWTEDDLAAKLRRMR